MIENTVKVSTNKALRIQHPIQSYCYMHTLPRLVMLQQLFELVKGDLSVEAMECSIVIGACIIVDDIFKTPLLLCNLFTLDGAVPFNMMMWPSVPCKNKDTGTEEKSHPDHTISLTRQSYQGHRTSMKSHHLTKVTGPR